MAQRLPWCARLFRFARQRSFWRQAERGEDAAYEFTAAIVPIMIMIMLIAFATLARASQMPVWMAATECARAAAATRDETTARQQAEQAALDSLAGNVSSVSTVQVDISGDWTPGSQVTCRVSYDIDVSGIAFMAEITGGRLPTVAEVTLRLEPYKSRWE
ncbi:MAG: hypothetical protein M1546_14860 [Chloroflexi bacterium]|nr:hypothetical protein [Chloroflexota bacterium]